MAVDEGPRPLRPEAYSDAWSDLCEAAGVPRVTLHGARHGSVTRMRNAGVPGHLVAAFHGHTEAVMALTYSHVEVQKIRGRCGSA